MNANTYTSAWIHYFAIVLGILLSISLISITVLTVTGRHISEIFIILGLVAATGLVRLLISPLNQSLC